MNHSFSSSFLTASVLCLALAGCGGPLSHTADAYDASKVDNEQRRTVDAAESEAADAGRRMREAEDRVPVAAEALENAERSVENAEHALELAKAELTVEEVKDDGDERSNVAGAESDVSQKERDLAVSEAEVELAQQKLERSKLAAVDAKRAWLVALAKVEVAKSDAAGRADADAEASRAELATQLREAEADHAAMKEKLAAADQAVSAAEDGVNKAKTDN
jgi:hypothetical protein